MASEATPQIPASKGIMTFHPTMEEFQNFTRYIAYMESHGAHKAGLAKIVPPKEWKPRSNYDDIDELLIPAPIQQVVSGQSGLFVQYNIQKKAMTVSEFRKLANSEKFCCPRHANFEELERKYWKNVTFNPPIYGADVNGTLYDPEVKDWNIGKLNTILDTVEHESGITIEGVNTPYLYFGMWKTTFAWHTEDMDLYSINYLHFGEPKSWYCVPPEHGKRMERLTHGFFPSSAQNCEAFLRHKMTLISPSILRKYGIPFERITQHAGEFMVTFPYSYHAGFNHGFNCAESTNFATERWIEYGKRASLCSCRKDMVKISMDVFVKKYQPERYEQWLAGRDLGCIDHSQPTPEAKEFLGEELGDSSSSQEICVDGWSLEAEKKSPTLRIGTKRHRVCLEVPEDMVPKEEEEEEEEFIKRPRLSLLPPRAVTEENRKLKGPPKLVVTPTKLTLMELPSLRTGSPSTLPAAFRAQVQPFPRNGHLRVPSLPSRPGLGATYAQPVRKLGVASLLFHKTLSPKEALQVQGSTQPQQQHHMQLHVHSYAREHQPRPLQHKAPPQSLAQGPSQAGTQDFKITFTKVEQDQAKATSGEERTAQGPSQPRPSGEAQAPLERSVVKAPPVQSPALAKGLKTGEGADRKKEVPQVNKRKGAGEQSYCKTVKDKQQAQLLSLPRQHPLLRAGNTSSDEDVEVDVGVEYVTEQGNLWAKPLAQLWQNRPFNPQAERDYNHLMGQQPPYCSVCLLFYTHHQLESSPDTLTLVGHRGGQPRSKPLIPEMCFNTVSKAANESGEGHLSTPHLEKDGTSRLLSCSQCCVRVHASCYGVSAEEAELDDWLCARCKANAITEDCCLCSLRGGALQRANNNKWVHVLCAITVLEARFVDIADRSPIDLTGIPLSRFKLKCQFCRKRMRRELNGCCVQCSHGRCSTSFHPTCAQAAGVLMYPDDWPFVVYVTCHRHKAVSIPERSKTAMRELEVGQKVISKFKNGRYYHSEVVELTSATFYEVVFDDGSYSDNLFPEDIENRDCVRLGPPSEGDVVQVRWTDGLIYGAKFVKSHSIPMYQVEFEDGSQISVKREEIYSLEENLPKRVKSRMSVASDQRFGIFTEKDVKKNSKRQRVINSRYREDYIEPVIYRTILD
ncbi:lysine-specific demethylase 4A [Aplochiton taeniatus]